jgi:hypothetical protein
MSLQPGVLVQVLQDKTTGSIVLALPATIKHHAIYIRGVGAISAGAVQLGTSSANGYSGTFAPIGTPVTVPANGETVVNIGPAVLNCLKFSFSTPVAGGVASIYYFGG